MGQTERVNTDDVREGMPSLKLPQEDVDLRVRHVVRTRPAPKPRRTKRVSEWRIPRERLQSLRDPVTGHPLIANTKASSVAQAYELCDDIVRMTGADDQTVWRFLEATGIAILCRYQDGKRSGIPHLGYFGTALKRIYRNLPDDPERGTVGRMPQPRFKFASRVRRFVRDATRRISRDNDRVYDRNTRNKRSSRLRRRLRTTAPHPLDARNLNIRPDDV